MFCAFSMLQTSFSVSSIFAFTWEVLSNKAISLGVFGALIKILNFTQHQHYIGNLVRICFIVIRLQYNVHDSIQQRTEQSKSYSMNFDVFICDRPTTTSYPLLTVTLVTDRQTDSTVCVCS